MGRLTLAFKVLFNAAVAKRVASILTDDAPAEVEHNPANPPPRSNRGDAISLLAALQREARFVDFIQESIEGYSDAQIGAAVRDIHRDCREAFERMFAVRPIVDQPEGSRIDIPQDLDVATCRLTGNVSDVRPTAGVLLHHGWLAEKCDVPEWTGSAASRFVLSPTEIEVKSS